MRGTRTRPKVVTVGGARGVIGHAGTRLLTELSDTTGLTGGFVQAVELTGSASRRTTGPRRGQ